MELNKNHRDSLIKELVKTREEMELGKSVSNASNKEWYTEHFKDWQDIKLFLLEERIKLIEKSLEDNKLLFNSFLPKINL